MKPWHLCSEAERQRVIDVLDSMGTEGNMLDASCPSAYRAAAAVLRDAAPWPDEALFVDYQGMIFEIIGEPVRGWVDVRSSGGHWMAIYAPRCVPLTPAAAEFLAAMGGGT